MSARSPLLGAAAVAAVVSVVMALLLVPGHESATARLFDPLERWTYDARFRVRGVEPVGDAVVLVVLDDKTLKEAPELLQRRAGFAALLDAVDAAGARTVGVDAFFAEAEAALAPALVDDVAAFVDGVDFAGTAEPAGQLLRRVRDETRGDEQLERSLRKMGSAVLALHASSDGVVLDDDSVRGARFGQIGGAVGATPVAERMLTSLPRFTRAAGAAGLATVVLDDDQVGRRLAAARRHGDAVLAPMAVHIAARMKGIAPARVGYLPGEAIMLGPQRLPLTSSAAGDTLLLRFRGPRGSFPTWSAVDVLRGNLPKDALRDRAVLVGFTYLTHDVSPTPFDGSAPGLEVHATAVDNLLANDLMRRAPAWMDALWTLALGLLAALSFSRVGPQRAGLRLLVPLLLLFVAAAVAQAAFARGVWLALAVPAATAVLASSSALVTAYVSEGVERRRLRKAFAHYLADEIIDELMSNPQALALGGARRQVTLLFSDIRGFTSLSEKMAPEALSRFLNAYLTPMTQAVLSERGFVDKYIGDALMAVFGAPAPSQDHPDRALSAAVRMHQELGTLRLSLDATLDIGIGINTGEAVAGNMGSAERFDYTVIGDAVNLASRLEGLTKKYGVFCIVGDDTKKLATPQFQFREIDRVRVKGRSQPVAIHQLLAGPGHVVAACVDVDEWHAALAAFRAGDFVAAQAAFTSQAKKNPDDSVARLFLMRLAALPPQAPADWDGVLDHHEK